MAKTDDPYFDSIQELHQEVDSLKQKLYEQTRAFDLINKSISAVNAFLFNKYPNDLTSFSIVDWHSQELVREQQARDIRIAIMKLEANGYIISHKEDHIGSME